MQELKNVIKKIGIKNIENKNVLFLQGPMGFFFNNLSIFINKNYKSKVFNIAYNGGDEYFLNNPIPIIGNNEKIITKTIELIQKEKINSIFLLGDEREIHSYIIKWKEENNIELNIYVFEEGYFRPNYITIEENGVNNNSTLDLSYETLKKLDLKDLENRYEEPENIKEPYKHMAWQATMYYFFSTLKYIKYNQYTHHRDSSIINEGYYGAINFLKLKYYKLKERKHIDYISETITNNFIFFPLQVESDFQIKKHSPFNNIEESIHEFFRLYTKYNSTEYIVIKHHPMDRGKNDYNKIIRLNAIKFNIDLKKIMYIYDVDLPTCLKHAKKCITVNSTVGLSALIHELPVFLMGEANYNIKTITNTEIDFFTNVKQPDMDLFNKLKYTIIEATQVNGSFYKEL